jgi:hypothetical protein
MTQNIKNFSREVFSKAPDGLEKKALEIAIDHYAEFGETRQWDVTKCIQLAGRIQQENTASTRTPPDFGLFSTLETDTLVSSEFVLSLIRRGVEDVRKEVFGESDPPFEDYSEAVKWIEQHPRTRPPLTKVQKQTCDRIEKDIRARIGELQNLERLDYRLSSSSRLLAYARTGEEWVNLIPVIHDSSLDPIERFVKRTSKETGFREVDLLAHILTGLPIKLPRFELKQSWPPRPTPSRITITIYAQNVTWEDFRAMYQVIKAKRKKRVNLIDDVDQAVFVAVEKLGGLPPKGKTAFWKQVLHECREHGVRSITKWQGVRRRYIQLQEKLQT